MAYTNNKFESIKAALQKKSESIGSGLYKEILKFKPNNTYVLRLLPSKNDDNPFVHFYQHYWESFATGESISVLSLQTFGKRDPIGSELYRLKKKGTLDEQEKAKSVKWSEYYYVNVYVVDDPVTPENNGKVKILRFGNGMYEKFMAAIDGEDSEDFGPKVFDLSKNGVNLKIPVKAVRLPNGTEVPNYDQSRFTNSVDLHLTDERIEEIYDSVYDLNSVLPEPKSEEELKELWRKHYLCLDGETNQLPTKVTKKEETQKVETPTTKSTNTDDCDLDDDDVASLLSSVDDDNDI